MAAEAQSRGAEKRVQGENLLRASVPLRQSSRLGFQAANHGSRIMNQEK